MAHIVEFEVSGLVGRSSTYSQKLNANINIFFGTNGSGKTSLLKILHSAMSGDATLVAGVPFTKAQVKIYSISDDRVFVRTIENDAAAQAEDLQLISDTFVVYHDSKGRVLQKKEPKTTRLRWNTHPQAKVAGWSHRYLPTSRLYHPQSSHRYPDPTSALSDEALNRHFADAIYNLWNSYNSRLLTAVRKSQEEGLANILRDVLGDVPAEEETDALETNMAFQRVKRFLERQGSSNALTPLESFRDQYSTNTQLRRVVNDINRIEERIESVMAPREELERLVGAMFTGGKSVSFGDQTIKILSARNEQINLSSLSSGEKQLILLFIEGLLAERNSVMIDEPELSMHIDWQRSFVRAMERLNPHCQLILATHSPEIMADLSDNKIFSL